MVPGHPPTGWAPGTLQKAARRHTDALSRSPTSSASRFLARAILEGAKRR
jgi:hypothetical protein